MVTKFGFTLIELIIAVSVIGILAMVALPNYQDAVRKSRRSEAHSALITMQLQQENYRMINPSYAEGFGSGPNDIKAHPTGYYRLTISNYSATTYTLTANAVSEKSQIADSGCSAITINQDGDKTPSQCW